MLLLSLCKPAILQWCCYPAIRVSTVSNDAGRTGVTLDRYLNRSNRACQMLVGDPLIYDM